METTPRVLAKDLSRSDVTDTKETRAPRRATKTRETSSFNRRLPAWLLAALFLLTLIVGIVAGILIMRQRYQSRQIVAAVNGELITQDDLYNHLERMAGVTAVRNLVDEKLALQFAQKKGLMPTDAEVRARLEEEKKKPDFAENLKKSGRAEADFTRMLRMQMARAKVIQQGIEVTEEDARRFYQTNSNPKDPAARYYTPETIQLAVIVTKTQAAAERARQELNSGVAFPTVAKKYSVDDTRNEGGITGVIARGRTQAAQIPGFEARVFQLKIGQLIGPERIANLWWIIRCVDKKAARTIPYEQVKAECLEGAAVLKGAKAKGDKVQEEFAKFRKESKLQAFWPQYKTAMPTE
jgi:parvulin-like peptidyl-prolyl isomerase